MLPPKYKIYGSQKGSALVLTIVLSSILAIIGVLFMLGSRVEKLSTSAATDERDLENAIESLVNKIKTQLVLDTPGVAGQEYYDYPGDEDIWLASSEPYDKDGIAVTENDCIWLQISDPTGYLRKRYSELPFEPDWSYRNVRIEPLEVGGNYQDKATVPEYPQILLDKDGRLLPQSADADGDGIADSKWIELEDSMTSKGKPVYAAVRIIDSGSMVNINSAYRFDSNSSDSELIDGSRLNQINLAEMARGTDDISEISLQRSGIANPTKSDLETYEDQAVWRMAKPINATLFNISDELEVRYRYCINSSVNARLENAGTDPQKQCWDRTIGTAQPAYPYAGQLDYDMEDWIRRMIDPSDSLHDRRHCMTTYNIDRIIAADTNDPRYKMFNVNIDPDELDEIDDDYTELRSWEKARELYLRTIGGIDLDNITIAARKDIKRKLAQLAVNLVDLRDRDADVTALSLAELDDEIGLHNDYFIDDFVYGVEPFPVITQVAVSINPTDPCAYANRYGVELYNPFDQPITLTGSYDFTLEITDVNSAFDPCDPNTFGNEVLVTVPFASTTLDPDQFLVITNNMHNVGVAGTIQIAQNFVLSSGYSVTYPGSGSLPVVDSNIVDSHNIVISREVEVPLDHNSPASSLTRRKLYVDRQLIYKDWVRFTGIPAMRFFSREYDLDTANWWDAIYPDMTADYANTNGNLLGTNDYSRLGPDPNNRPLMDIAVPYHSDQNLVTVGDIARIWAISHTDTLFDPFDADNQAVSSVFDSTAVNRFDPNDPAFDPNNFDPNDANSLFTVFNIGSRTLGENLRFISESIRTGRARNESLMRVNLADPLLANIFQYITVFDPTTDGIDNNADGLVDNSVELKVPGRINVNTAGKYVIQQLPWMTDEIAESIISYRDKTGRYRNGRYNEIGRYIRFDWIDRFLYRSDVREERGFASIGELNLVTTFDNARSIWTYGLGAISGPLLRNGHYFPDLTDAYGFNDEADNDFEERDLLFARISNLVTVRSDVFTAYILVRLGTDGPQKRMLAILDRSDVYGPKDKVKIIALHQMPNPR